MPKPTAYDIDNHIMELAKRAKLDSWTAFVEELKVPPELVPALMTGRPELIRLAPARACNADEVKVLLTVIGGLLETNYALREHAAEVAQLVRNWTSAFDTLGTVGRKIGKFALFQHADAAKPDED